MMGLYITSVIEKEIYCFSLKGLAVPQNITADKVKQMQVFTHVAFAPTFLRTSEEIK